MATACSIETAGLSRRFGAVVALDDLGLQVERGIVFGFLGPNGAGKTTTIKLLLGMLQPSQGEARVLGVQLPAQVAKLRPRVGVLLEHSGTYGRLSVSENLDFFAGIYRLPREPARRRGLELAERLGLSGLLSRKAEQLSTGERRKLGLVRALLHSPELLFLDEPTAGLDAPSAAALRKDLAELVSQSGLTVFLTTHHLEDAERLCQQVAVIRRGRLIATGTPSQLAARFREPLVSLRADQPELALELARAQPGVVSAEQLGDSLQVRYAEAPDSAALNRALVLAGVAVHELRVDSGEFERAFLELVKED